MSTACWRLHRRVHHAGEKHRVARRPDLDRRVRQHGAERLAQHVEVAPDRDFERRDLASLGVHHEDRGGAVVDADHEHFSGRAHHRVRHLGVGDEDLLGVARQVDDDAAADREIEPTGDGLLPVFNMDHRGRDRRGEARRIGRPSGRGGERRDQACRREEAVQSRPRAAPGGRSHRKTFLRL
jgi:hypothetical protein